MSMKRTTLYAARKRRKLTQTQLSRLAGVAQTTVSKLECGTVASPSYDIVVRLASALAIDPRALRFGQRPDVVVSA